MTTQEPNQARLEELRKERRNKVVDSIKTPSNANEPKNVKCSEAKCLTCGAIEYTNYLDSTGGYCAKCHEERESKRKKTQADKEREHIRTFTNLSNYIHVPRLYDSAMVSDFENLDLGESLLGAFYLFGIKGCGKTRLAVALAREAYASFWPARATVKYIKATEILLDLRSTMREKSHETELDIVKRYVGYPILIIDDLGAEKITDYSLSMLLLILDKRIEERQGLTIITSNLAPSKWEVIEDRFASRFAGMKQIVPSKVDWRAK